jgi:hypothetical protein
VSWTVRREPHSGRAAATLPKRRCNVCLRATLVSTTLISNSPCSPAELRSIRSSSRSGNHVRQLGLGDGCLRIDTANQQQTFISLSGQAKTECLASPVKQPGGPNGVNHDDEKALDLDADGVRYSLTAQAVGTAFLSVTAHAGERQLWQANLRSVKADSGLAMVVTPGVLVVYASDPTDDHYGVLIGLDPRTGAERYSVRQDSHWSGNLFSLHFNGRYVIAAWGYGLHAYEPTTGDRVWHIGGR